MTDYYHSYLINSSLRILSVNKSLVESAKEKAKEKDILISTNNIDKHNYQYYYDISTNCYIL
jgi:hypothetical protein